LDFTRHWNSIPSVDADAGFVSGGWTHSWYWGVGYDEDIVQAYDGGPQTWVTSITISFPDGRSSKYSISRGPQTSNGWGPPYSAAEADWSDPGTVTDHLRAMASDGSNFWLYLGDGGAVHFVDIYGNYHATEVFDPHGYRTDLQYDTTGRLIRVAQESGGRFLSIEWVYKQVNANSILVIGAVQTGGAAGTHRVEYNYSPYTVTQGNSSYTWYDFTDVKYVDDPFPGQETHSTYAYHTFTGLPGLDMVGPALEYADDKRFAGPMAKIRYTYRGSACHKADKPQFEPYNNARFDYFYAGANSIAAELSGETAEAVSSLTLGCFTGVRKETSGLGGWRNLYFGRSAGSDPGGQFIGDIQTGHWEPPEAGQGNYQGYHLVKVTDFYTSATPDNVPFDFQHYYQDYPWRIFDGYGNITQLTRVQGQFGLDGSGRVSEVWHRGDNSKHTYNWTDPGASAARDTARIPNTYGHWLFSQTDERILTTTYRRDDRRRITDITYADSSSEHFTYNNTFNEVETHTLPSGTVQHYQYDGRGLLYQEWNDFDGPGAARIYTYDAFDRVATVSDGRSRSAEASYSTWMEYNGRNQVTKVHYAPTGGGSDPTMTYEYDAYGNCTAVTNELNQRSEYTYDSYRRCTSSTEPLNAPGWNGAGTVQSRRWDWIYDRYIDGVGGRGAYTHTANVWRIQIEPAFNAAGERKMTARWFDLQNRITLEQSGWVQPAGTVDYDHPNWYWSGADGETRCFGYDANGNKSSYTDPRGHVTTYEYDNRNRLWKTNDTINTLPRTTETLYDTTGNKTLVRFPDNATQQWLDYDPFGQPRRFIDERANPTKLTYWWGPMKKLRSVTTRRDDGSDEQPTVFMSDGMGRLLQTLFPDGSHEDSTYEFGQPKTWQTRKGAVKTIQYDARGRESSHSWSDGTPGITSTWDDASRRLSLANIFSTIDYQYDSAAQPIYEGNTITGSGGRMQTTFYRYPNGDLANLVYPAGPWVRHDYTARGQLKTAGVADGSGNWAFQLINYYYHADGKVEHQDYGNGMGSYFGYDGRGMVNWIWHKRNTTGQNVSYRDYYRDTRDRIVGWKRSSDTSVNPRENGRGDHYLYDEEGQLYHTFYDAADPANSGDGAWNADAFEYDALGNRRNWAYSSTVGWTHYSRRDNGLNQYSSWTPSAINYEGNGVLTQEGLINSDYNALNQPIWMWSWNLSSPMYFGYDPLGRCVKRWFPDFSAPPTYMYYDGWSLIQEGINVWSPTRLYVQGNRVDELEVTFNVVTSQYGFHQYDARGHCILTTDIGGNMMEEYDYDAWGKPHFYSASSGWSWDLGYSEFGNRFLFTGREWLSGLGVYDYRNRLYHPELGRFLQPDPKEFAAGDYNLYRYCHNDPVNKSDPLGLLEFEIEGDKAFQAQIRSFIATIDSKPACHAYLNELRASPFRQVFVPGSANQTRALNGPDSMNGKGAGSKYESNPAQKDSGKDSTGNTQRPGFIGVAHETVGHGIENARGQHVPKALDNSIDRIPKSEKAAIQRENEVRKEHSIPERVDFYKKWP
jgi:RHS repeat-associated protein